ncbi:hypothetical protein ACIQ9E_14630 [Streptomyces sp. NPDC094448]
MTISASFAAAKRNRVSLPQSERGAVKKSTGAAQAAERPVRIATFNSSL